MIYECNINDCNEYYEVKSINPFAAAMHSLSCAAEEYDLRGGENYKVVVSDDDGNTYRFSFNLEGENDEN